jgi:phytoene desaturase
MEAMARVARDLGVRIRTNTMVEQIVFKGRRATGVRTRAGQYDCDALVINADFAGAISRLVPDGLRRRWTDAKLARKRFSCSTFMLYLGIAGRVDLDHHTIFLAEDYARNLKEIEEGRVLPRSPSLYIQNACVTDAGQAPQGCSTLTCWYPYRIIARTSTGGERPPVTGRWYCGGWRRSASAISSAVSGWRR